MSARADRAEGAGRYRFTGHIAGMGTTGGTRLVLGAWHTSVRGPFCDVMVAHPDGTRELIAPNEWVAEFVAATYTFDRLTIVPVQLRRTGTSRGSRWWVAAGPLEWSFTLGSRTPLGYALAAVPGPLARSLAWAQVTDRIAPLVLPGVRTLGTAGGGRTEWYAARDLHRIREGTARWGGTALGDLAPVWPPPEFGFGSTPATPAVTALTSTVQLPG